MGYLDYAGLQYLWGKLKEKFAPRSHSHDDRYYTEAEMDGKLNSKSNTNHTHDASTLINALGTGAAAPTDPDYIITQWVGGGTSNTTWVRRPMSSIWNYIKGKADGVYQPKGSYAASGHTHDDRYYTESEMNTKLSAKAENIVLAHNANLDNVTTPGFYSCGGGNSISNKPTGTDAIGLIVTHNASGDYYTQILTTSSNANTYRRTCLNGTWSGWMQDKYTDTNTWRGIQNNLTSDSTSDSLSAAQGKALKGLIDGKAPKDHTHTKSQVGLGNVDNTADADKSVKYAANAGSANTANGISISDPILATGVENSEITGKTNGNVSFSNYNQSSGIWGMRNALDFRWYKTHWQVGNIRGASDNSTGFGFAFSNDGGQTFALKSRIDTDGVYQGKATTAGYADSAGSVAWGNISDKPSSYPPASHTHAYLPLSGGTMTGALNFANGTWNVVGGDVRFGDNNTSGSFYIQGLNGPTNIKLKKKGDTSTGSGDSATITYDGGNLVIDKTIQANLSGNASTATKAISADKATSASSADKAAKLTTARTVSGGSDITLSFNYDGSGNSTANIGFYSCKHNVNNTSNYPFHRFARLDVNKGAWVDKSITFLISQDYSGGGYGICRLVYRSNADSGSASVDAQWLVRRGFSADTIQVAIKTDKTNGAYCDAFYKSSGTYMSVVIRAIASGGRANSGRTWTLVDSNEVDGTTATDKKTSSECWKTIADAGIALHKQAYSASGPAKDEGYVASAGSANTSSSCAGNSASATKLTSSAGSATQPVYFKDGKPVAGTYTLCDASSKMVRTLSAQGNSGWANQTTDDKYVPTMSFMAYWNGAYGGTSSNLQYCDRGRFGTIVTKGSGDYAAASHTHNYAGSGSAGGSANSAIKLDSSAGSAIQPVYFKDGKPVATTYTLNKTVPADAKFTDTNTWRGIQNNLTSDSTDQSLSAAQGKALKTLVDGKAPTSHNHTKSQITDFPTSMPASDVSAWAKAATKPSYTKAEVGLSNVDNTADKDKSVKYATSAGSASQLNGFTIQASTSDLTAGYSRLNNNVIYIVYE